MAKYATEEVQKNVAKVHEVNRLVAEQEISKRNACKQVGLTDSQYFYYGNLEKKNGAKPKDKAKPKKSDVVVVHSDDTKEEDVKIVVMKGPGHVIEKIAAALGGVL